MAEFTKALIAPTVNLNGTDASVLIEGLMNCKVQIDAALEKMQVATPHGRDYIDGKQLQEARRAWFERTHALSKLASEITDLAIEIQNQKKD